jgi:hypothetical protein
MELISFAGLLPVKEPNKSVLYFYLMKEAETASKLLPF